MSRHSNPSRNIASRMHAPTSQNPSPYWRSWIKSEQHGFCQRPSTNAAGTTWRTSSPTPLGWTDLTTDWRIPFSPVITNRFKRQDEFYGSCMALQTMIAPNHLSAWRWSDSMRMNRSVRGIWTTPSVSGMLEIGTFLRRCVGIASTLRRGSMRRVVLNCGTDYRVCMTFLLGRCCWNWEIQLCFEGRCSTFNFHL